jgi:hypothetical protein
MRIFALALVLSAAAVPALAQQPGAPSAAQLHLRMLTWPGKVQTPAPRQAAPAPRAAQVATLSAPATASRDPAWRPAYRPVPHGSSHMLGDLTPAQAQAVDAQRAEATAEADKARVDAQVQIQLQAQAERQAKAQAQAQAQAQPRRQAPAASLPQSIYAPPPPAQAATAMALPPARTQPAMAAPPIAVASAYDQKAHYYSLHRAYGQRPDPITLSPQFLSSPSADLADPPPPPLPRILPNSTATAAQQTAARVQQRASSDSGN